MLQKLSHAQLVPKVRNIVPKMTGSNHKGQHGKIAVIGGCFEYTGAPFISAISSVKTGSDLAYVFCSKDAAVPIKSYGPELIVLGALRTIQEQQDERVPSKKEDIVGRIKEWLPRIHSLVIGPGLGRDSFMHECVTEVVNSAKSEGLPIVFDGDGIWAVENDPNLVMGYDKATITANFNEYSRLCSKVLKKKPEAIDLPEQTDFDSENEKEVLEKISGHVEMATQLAKHLGNVTLVCKGSFDIITNGNSALLCSLPGSPRRCGGIGDVLAGTIGTFNAWAHLNADSNSQSEQHTSDSISPMMLAAYGGCALTRDSSKACYSSLKRSMVAHDVVGYLGPRFQALFEHQNKL